MLLVMGGNAIRRAAISGVRSALAPVVYHSLTMYIEGIPASEIATMGYYSQIGQDVLLDRHLFAGRRDGVFVDVGAHDGRSFSNSLFLETERGWHGLCVEANPTEFERLRANRTCACVNVAVAAAEARMPFLVATGPDMDMLSGLEATYDPRVKAQFESDTSPRGSTTVIEVDAQRLDVLARSHDITHIDFLGIDVEGGEAGVLDSLDLREFAVGVVIIENKAHNWSIARRILRQGYRLLARLQTDEVYVREPVRLRCWGDSERH